MNSYLDNFLMIIFALLLPISLGHIITINSYSPFLFENETEFLETLKAIDSINYQIKVTLTSSITLKPTDFPISPHHQLIKDQDQLMIEITSDSDDVILTLNLTSQNEDRFQYIFFRNIKVKFIGSSLKVTRFALTGTAEVVSTNENSIEVDSIYFSLYHSHLKYFNVINFSQLYVYYMNNDNQMPKKFPTFNQKIRYPESNAIYFPTFEDNSNIVFSHDSLMVNNIKFNIPEYNYTVSFYFEIKEATSCVFSGNYSYNPNFKNYFGILHPRCSITFKDGNYLPEDFRYTSLYEQELYWEYNKRISEISIGYNCTFYPQTFVNCSTFSYNSNSIIEGDLDLYCDTFDISTPELQSDTNHIKISTNNLNPSTESLTINGDLELTGTTYLFSGNIVANTINFTNSPRIIRNIVSGQNSIANTPILTAKNIYGSANLSINGLTSESMVDNKKQNSGVFYKILETDNKFEGPFVLGLEDDSLYSDYKCIINRGFSLKTSVFQVEIQQENGKYRAGLKQTKALKDGSIRISSGQSLSNSLNEFTSYIYIEAQSSSMSIDISAINHPICDMEIITKKSYPITITGSDIGKYIEYFQIHGDGIVIFDKTPITLNYSVIIDPDVQIQGKENLKFTENAEVALSSLNTLNSLSSESISSAKKIVVSGERISQFDFIDNGWQVTTLSSQYKVENINPKFLSYSPTGSISFSVKTDKIQSLNFYLTDEIYIFPDWSGYDVYPFILRGSPTIALSSSVIPIQFDETKLVDDYMILNNIRFIFSDPSLNITHLTVRTKYNITSSFLTFVRGSSFYNIYEMDNNIDIIFEKEVWTGGFVFHNMNPIFKSSLTYFSGSFTDFKYDSPGTIEIYNGGSAGFISSEHQSVNLVYKLTGSLDLRFPSTILLNESSVKSLLFRFEDNHDLNLAKAYSTDGVDFNSRIRSYIGTEIAVVEGIDFSSSDSLISKMKFANHRLNVATDDFVLKFEYFVQDKIFFKNGEYQDSYEEGLLVRSPNIGRQILALRIIDISENKLSGGAIAAITLGSMAGVATIGGTVGYIIYRKKFQQVAVE